MSVEPGRRLAGRYRVEDLIADRVGARSWRAVDEVLRRSVAVDVLPADTARASALMQAARLSAVVNDGRFLRVLDASEEDGDVYVVREWARGEPLDLLLADGPLTHQRAAWLVREVAEALGAAHAADIYHLRLTPENIIVTDTGAVKIVGLATDAALHETRYADAEAEDVRALGRLLYAALVGRWPNGTGCSLPEAPTEHGRLLRPRQVRAGVPRPVDQVCDRILGEPPRHQAEPLLHARDVAAELNGTAGLLADSSSVTVGADGTARLAAPVGVLNGHERPGAAAAPAQSAASAPDPHRPVPARSVSPGPVRPGPVPPGPVPPRSAPRRPAARSSGLRRGLVWLAVAAVVATLATVAFLVGLRADGGDGAGEAQPQDPTTGGLQRAAAPAVPVRITEVSAWDPFGEDGEHDSAAGRVLDGRRQTAWTTLSYFSRPEFGGLKPGLGLRLDLGQTTAVRRVTLGVGGSGTALELRAATGTAAQPPVRPRGYRTVHTVEDAAGRTVIKLAEPVTTRHLLVWLTSLPPEGDSTYRGRISEISVAG